MFKFLILLSLFVPSLWAQSWKSYHLVNGCMIFDLKGKSVRNFPGTECQFFPDGRFLSIGKNGLSLFNKDSQLLWAVPGSFHHQLNLNIDGSKILAITQEAIVKKSERLKVDKLMVIALNDGKILHHVLASDLYRMAKLEERRRRAGPDDVAELKVQEEISHINSFYEIPKLRAKLVPGHLRSGDYVVNGREDGIFFLSPDLKHLRFHFHNTHSQYHQVHDVQVLENGRLLYFNNLTADSQSENRSSAIQELDLNTNKVVFEFAATPKTLFYSPVAGSVQPLDGDHILFTHVTNGTFIYSKKQNKIVSSLLETHEGFGYQIRTQQVKAVDLISFLNHWK